MLSTLSEALPPNDSNGEGKGGSPEINLLIICSLMDRSCHLRFDEKIGEVFPPAVDQLKKLLKKT
jgi:hypothetical protein